MPDSAGFFFRLLNQAPWPGPLAWLPARRPAGEPGFRIPRCWRLAPLRRYLKEVCTGFVEIDRGIALRYPPEPLGFEELAPLLGLEDDAAEHGFLLRQRLLEGGAEFEDLFTVADFSHGPDYEGVALLHLGEDLSAVTTDPCDGEALWVQGILSTTSVPWILFSLILRVFDGSLEGAGLPAVHGWPEQITGEHPLLDERGIRLAIRHYLDRGAGMQDWEDPWREAWERACADRVDFTAEQERACARAWYWLELEKEGRSLEERFGEPAAPAGSSGAAPWLRTAPRQGGGPLSQAAREAVLDFLLRTTVHPFKRPADLV